MTDKLNRCYFQAASSGTGDFVFASAVAGFFSPDDAGAVDGDTVAYIAENGSPPTEWEIGTGTYTSGSTTLARTTVIASSNSGSPVTFSAAPKVRMGVVLAADFGASVTNPLTANLEVGAYNIVGDAGGDGVYIAGGDAASGGPVDVTAGDSSDAGESGGSAILRAGQGTFGGNALVRGGAGTGDAGGNASVQAGNSLGDAGPGGNASISAGNGSSGGYVALTPGTGTGDGGDLYITLPAAGSGRQGLVIASNMPTSDPGVTDALWNDEGVPVFSGSTRGLGGLADDPAPHLGGNLDVNNKSIISKNGLTNGGALPIASGNGASGNGGAMSLKPGTGGVNGGDLTITLPAAGSGRQGLMIVSNLPTSDPGVSGALWSNLGVLTISP